MNYLVCSKCGASIPIDDIEKQICFCTMCGSKISVSQPQPQLSISDGIIMDYYVNAVENEIYHNRDLAIHNYKKILEYRPEFAPAKRGLARIDVMAEMEEEPAKEVSYNVTVRFSSVKTYLLSVQFEKIGCDKEDEEPITLTLLPGDEKGINLKPVPHMATFNIGRREYRRYFVFEKPNTRLTIDYVFDGVNHISFSNEQGDDLTEIFSELSY